MFIKHYLWACCFLVARRVESAGLDWSGLKLLSFIISYVSAGLHGNGNEEGAYEEKLEIEYCARRTIHLLSHQRYRGCISGRPVPPRQICHREQICEKSLEKLTF